MRGSDPKFRQGDIVFLKRKLEEVTVLKLVVPDDPRNQDLGPCYLIRAADDKIKTRYQFELVTPDEARQLKAQSSDISY